MIVRSKDPDTSAEQADNGSVLLGGLAGDDVGRDDRRPPLVLLHGLSFDRRMWRPALEELRSIDPGRRVLALDLPGHGESRGWPAYNLELLAEGVHRSIREAQLESPIVVGHSISALVATVYAARHPSHGVINVDQGLQVAPFARLVQSLAERLRGPEFASVWQNFAASMHTEVLPLPARELLVSISKPRQDLVLAYWADALERPPEELGDWAGAVLGELRASSVPYLIVSGQELDGDYRRWLFGVLPQAEVAVWPASGHFPHLAHPDCFAELLAATGLRGGAA